MDCCQGTGIGKELLRRLIGVAKQEGLESVEAVLTSDNNVMIKMCESLKFEINASPDGKMVNAVLNLA
jgi:L-amino acid N-acyltransferase YncA